MKIAKFAALPLVVLAFGIFCFALPALAADNLANWKYRKPITLTNSGDAKTDYPVKVSVSYASHMNSDFSDLRFVAADGSTILDYWVESSTVAGDATVWVEVKSIPSGSSTIYLYYGNLTAASASNGDATFSFFDNFSGTSLNANKWTKSTSGKGTVTVDNGVSCNNPDLNADAAAIRIVNPGNYNLFDGSMEMEFQGKIINSGISHPFGFALIVADSGEYISLSNFDVANGIIITNQTGPNHYSESPAINGYTKEMARWRFYGDGATTRVSVNGVGTAFSMNYPVSAVPQMISIGPLTSGIYNPNEVYLSWLFIRKRSAAEPAYAIGDEQAMVACTNECATSGAAQCSGISGYQTCGNYDSDACLEWSVVTNCPSGQSCSGGVCAAAPDSCSSHHSKKCHDGDVYWYDSCGGREGLYDACSGDQICSDGKCVDSDSENECEENHSKKCYGGDIYWYDSCGSRGKLYKDCGDNATTTNYRCNGSVSQKEMTVRDCVDAACTEESAWTDAIDCLKSGKICRDGACVSGDTTPPALSGLGPSGTLDDANAVLTVTTTEAAECRYSWYDKDFAAMTLAFDTADHLAHAAKTVLSGYGSYAYYVRCRDNAGNVNPAAGRIAFKYAAKETPAAEPPADAAPPADTTPPKITGLGPNGVITAGTAAELTAATDENATCKYDSADKDYDSMGSTMDGAGSASHRASVTLQAAGNYTYYLRCGDSAGNKNKQSEKINFDYIPPKEGPKISDPQPAGKIYQGNVTLAVTTDKVADCRYSTADKDYDLMADAFSNSDGQHQTATVALDDYGSYTYFVRCKDADGNKDAEAGTIQFEYAEANPVQSAPSGQEEQAANEPVACAEYKNGNSDGACDNRADCVCDPDCSAGGDGADPDCANVSEQTQANPVAIILICLGGFVVFALIVAVVIIGKRRKKQSGGGQDAATPNAPPVALREVPKF